MAIIAGASLAAHGRTQGVDVTLLPAPPPPPSVQVVVWSAKPEPTLEPDAWRMIEPEEVADEIAPPALPSPAPPPAVQAASAAPVVPIEGKLTESEVRKVLGDAGWPDELVPQALAVAFCESRYGPGSVNAGGPRGLFQIQPFWADFYGIPRDSLFDPVTNARIARWIWQRSGNFGAWSCSPN